VPYLGYAVYRNCLAHYLLWGLTAVPGGALNVARRPSVRPSRAYDFFLEMGKP